MFREQKRPMNANWLLVRKRDDGTETSQLPAAPFGRMNAATWVDSTGRLWLFGGHADYGSHNHYFADMWYYDTTKFQWNLVHESPSRADLDSGAFPPPRDWPSCWIDEAGGLLLYGGLQNNAIR